MRSHSDQAHQHYNDSPPGRLPCNHKYIFLPSPFIETCRRWDIFFSPLHLWRGAGGEVYFSPLSIYRDVSEVRYIFLPSPFMERGRGWGPTATEPLAQHIKKLKEIETSLQKIIKKVQKSYAHKNRFWNFRQLLFVTLQRQDNLSHSLNPMKIKTSHITPKPLLAKEFH